MTESRVQWHDDEPQQPTKIERDSAEWNEYVRLHEKFRVTPGAHDEHDLAVAWARGFDAGWDQRGATYHGSSAYQARNPYMPRQQ